MSSEPHGPRGGGGVPPDADAVRTEPGREHHAHPAGRSAWLYGVALVGVVLLGILIAWVVANRGSVEVDWLLGTTDAALALVIFVAAAIGWVIGIATAVAIRRRAKGGRGPD